MSETKNSTDTPLSSLAKHKEAVITQVLKSNKALYQKLISMGIVEGTKVQIVARAPLGGPMNIRALGYQLSLRQSEAEHILVQLAWLLFTSSYFSRPAKEIARQQGENVNQTRRIIKSSMVKLKIFKTKHCSFLKEDFKLANVVLSFEKLSFTLLPLDFLTRAWEIQASASHKQRFQ